MTFQLLFINKSEIILEFQKLTGVPNDDDLEECIVIDLLLIVDRNKLML